jgi:hypothetical protein
VIQDIACAAAFFFLYDQERTKKEKIVRATTRKGANVQKGVCVA